MAVEIIMTEEEITMIVVGVEITIINTTIEVVIITTKEIVIEIEIIQIEIIETTNSSSPPPILIKINNKIIMVNNTRLLLITQYNRLNSRFLTRSIKNNSSVQPHPSVRLVSSLLCRNKITRLIVQIILFHLCLTIFKQSLSN